MKCEPSSPEPAAAPQNPRAENIAEDAQYCRRALLDLVDFGRELAAIVTEQARSEQDNPEATHKAIAAYNTVARSLRRTVMLHDKLGQPKRSRPDRTAARKKIIRDVEDAIQCNAPADEQETLHAEFLERLDSPDFEDDIAVRPIGDIVTDISRDLGLAGLDGTHPWKRRIPHDIAILNARAERLPGAGPSETLAALLASAPPPPPRRAPDPDDDDDVDVRTLARRLRKYRDSGG